MEDLLNPDFGVTILTICNFLLLVYLLKKFAWNSVIGALEKRENQIATDKAQAQQAREEAQQLKAELDEKLNRISQEASEKIAQAVKTGEAQRDELLAAAKETAQRLIDQAHAQIEAEKNSALADVRGEIVRTAVLAARRVVQQEMNETNARETVERVLNEIKHK